MKVWKTIAAEESGSEIAEAAFILPLVFALLFGIVWFGRAFNIYATLNRAAHEGAEAGALSQCATCDVNQTKQSDASIITNVIDPILASAHVSLDPAVPPTIARPIPLPGQPSQVVVTISYLYGFRLNGVTCCPLTMAPIKLNINLNATAQSQSED